MKAIVMKEIIKPYAFTKKCEQKISKPDHLAKKNGVYNSGI